MTPHPDNARNLTRLLKKIGKARGEDGAMPTEPVDVMVMSFLMWDSTMAKATAAYKRIRDRVVDFNDLRVTMPKEIVEFIGPRYPMAQTRAERLRAALRDTFHREHAVNLDRLFELGKREIKNYLRSLDGVSPYVADRVTLLSFEGHCIPVDERLRRALAREAVCEESSAIPELASWLARQVKAGDATRTHRVFQRWADRVGGVRGPKAAASR